MMAEDPKKLWISYSWRDNVDDDVDFIAEEIRKKGIIVNLDRFVLVAGQRLWPQIESNITDPDRSDAWAVFLTQNSLTSEAVREEIAYALERALDSRGGSFPLIGINPGDVEPGDVPAALTTRLYVSLCDEDWIERIVSGVRGIPPDLEQKELLPVFFKEHLVGDEICVEVRPRAGRWHPGLVAVPEDEWENVTNVMQGPSGTPALTGMISRSEVTIEDSSGRKWKGYSINHNITPINSIYLMLRRKTSYILAGQNQGPKYLYRPIHSEAGAHGGHV